MAGSRLRLALLLAWPLLAIAACTPSPEKLLADARTALAAGEMRTAEIHLKNLLQQQPDNAAARQMLGTVSLAAGDLAGAEVSLRRALQLGVDPATVQVPLVATLIRQRKLNEALEQIAQGPALTGPDRVTLLRLEGAAQRGLRAYPRAEAAYRAALASEPSSAEIRTELAAALLEGGRANDAREIVTAVLVDQPGFVPALLLRGSLEAAGRQYAAAEVTLQQAADLERSNAARSASYLPALAQLIEVQLAQSKLDAAAANADTLIALAPQNPVSRYMKAAVEVQQKDLDSAERRLESLIADVPEYWPAHRLLGAINVAQNQLGQATMYLRAAVNNNPTDNAARLQLAELYIRQGDVDAARRLMESSPSGSAAVSDGLFFAFAGRASQQAGLAEQAAKYFDQSERQTPDDVQQLVGMSGMYVAAGEFERAIRLLESASFDDPRSERITDYLLALVQVREGDLQAADVTAQRLVEQQPTAAWPLNLRGTIAMAGGDLTRAHELLVKAVELEPRNTASLLNLARVAAGRKNGAEAEQYLRQVVELDPQETTAVVGLAQLAAARGDFAASEKELQHLPPSPLRDRLNGELMAAQGRFEAAASAFASAYSAQPSGDLALRVYGAASRAGLPGPDAQLRGWSARNPQDPAPNFALGSIALEKGEQDEAIRRYEAVLAASPNHAPTMNNLAWLYNERGDARALDLAERAHAAEPNNPAIADTLGWLHVQRGAPAEGLPLLTQASAGLPDQAEVRYHLGVALAATGDGAKALETLQASLTKGDFPGREDAQKRVDALLKKP